MASQAMPGGIRATVEFTTPDICPVVELSAEAETTIDSVVANVCNAECTESVTEFAVDSEYDPGEEMTPIFSHGSTDRYRLSHEGGPVCPCESLGEFGCAIARYVAQNGTLQLVFHASDYEQLQDIVGTLRDRFPGVDIKRFVRSPATEQTEDSVLIDRSKLTHRQLEVLETAHEMGYFDRPRQANASEIAEELGINPSTFSEHLMTAQRKLFEDIV